MRRTGIAVLAGSMGVGVATVLSFVPPGLGRAQPGTLISAVLSDPALWRALIVAAAAISLSLMAVTRWQRSFRGIDAAATLHAAEPLLWGCGLPTLALLLDPWLFHRSAAILGAAGFALGALGTAARARRLPATRPAPARRTLALLVVAAVIVPTLLVLPGPPWFHPISGDEPHYLVIARSIWADGDVDVANEYSESLLAPFWPGELSPHAKPGADPEKSYSIHGTGLAVWLAPWYGAGSSLSEEGFNVLVRIAMSLWLAAGAACLFLLLGDIAGPTAATRGTVLSVFTLPLLFAGPHLFPAVPVFTLSCGAYLLIRRQPGPAGYLAAGLLLGALPWLHFKFFGVMAAVCLIGILKLWHREPSGARTLALAAFIAPQAISGLGHVAFTWALYGRISPLAIHVGADTTLRATAAGDDWLAYATDPLGALRTASGYLMDQREGLLFYAPHYLLAVAGFAWLLRRRRHDAVSLALVFLALVGPYALSQEIGHWAPPARPLTGVLWTLAVPMGIGLTLPAGDGRKGRWRSILRGFVVGWGVGATALLLLQADLLYHDYNVPRSLVLLRYGAPGLPLSEIAPLWIGPDGARWGPALLWLAAIAVLAIFLWRWGKNVAGTGSSHPDGASEQDGGAPDAEALAVQGDRPSDTPTIRAPLGAGYRAVAWLVVAAAAAFLVHHARVPLTDLHQAWTFGTIRYWKPVSPPTRAWPAENGVWTGGHDAVELLLSSPEPLELIVFELGTLAPMRAVIQVGNDRQEFRVRPGERAFARFTPGPATYWNGEYFYHLNVVAYGGVSPVALGIRNDGRGLGVLLEAVQTEVSGS